MMIKAFNIDEMDLNYTVGIGVMKIQSSEITLDFLYDLMEQFQEHYPDSMVQFFNHNYVLNYDHLFNACYYTLKAFKNGNNISNKRNLEFFLYLACSHQIKESLKHFGLNNEFIKTGLLPYCIISTSTKINTIRQDLSRVLYHETANLDMFKPSKVRFKSIIDHYKFTPNQLEVVLASYGHKLDLKEIYDEYLEDLNKVLNDLICEKMALLSLEKTR